MRPSPWSRCTASLGKGGEAGQGQVPGRVSLCVRLIPGQLGDPQAQETGCCGGSKETVYSLDGLPSDLRHDGTFSPKVFVAQAQEIIDDQGCERCPEKTTQTSRLGKQMAGF